MPNRQLVLGADHAGFELKEQLKQALVAQGWKLEDRTPVFTADDDFPPIGKDVAKKVAADPNTFGILICGSSGGMTIAANRIQGARAVAVRTLEDVTWARHDDMANILILGSRVTSFAQADQLTTAWLIMPDTTDERFIRRAHELDLP